MTLPEKINGPRSVSEVELYDVYEGIRGVQSQLRSLNAFPFKEAIDEGKLALRSINSARLAERLTRIEDLQRELGTQVMALRTRQSRLDTVEVALTQILEEQRKPWWKKVFRG